MPILLHHSTDIPPSQSYQRWVVIGNSDCNLPINKKCKNISEKLEVAFSKNILKWVSIAKKVGVEKSATLAHMPTCAANICDFGLMLAWESILSDLASEKYNTLVVCDDPWLFRHLKDLDEVTFGSLPALWTKCFILFLRGYLARARVAFQALISCIILRKQKLNFQNNLSYILVYGHPNSNSEGDDGYFGTLLKLHPNLKRILHVDARVSRVRALESKYKTASLHSWGSMIYSFLLPFKKWRPSREVIKGPLGFLIYRSACLEGGTGSAAMISWQIHCQRRWLEAVQPRVIAWPWENHSWERALVSQSKQRKIMTIGYQHSVVGSLPNYFSSSNPKDVSGLPDKIACNGSSSKKQLISKNIPIEKLYNVGALRQVITKKVVYDPKAPIFVALPFDNIIAKQMIAACKKITSNTRVFLIKGHPMSPVQFNETQGVFKTNRSFLEQERVSVVLFTATTVGLESWLCGIPTIRFLPEDKIAYNILPNEVSAPTATAENLEKILKTVSKPSDSCFEDFFGPVDYNFWKKNFLQP